MKVERIKHRVVKTLAPNDRGAIALAEKYGNALVCVRHRADAQGTIRQTTVELVVRTAAIRPRSVKQVHIQVAPHERAVHAMIRAAGGRWDGKTRLWRLPSRVVNILNLRHRVVPA